jgi:UDP-2,4-diacetamido-2,4,6-trideoxy-beta-L-altropyranose hydrolase
VNLPAEKSVGFGTLLVRADANRTIGMGHAMRCLALAQAWQDAGGEAVFAMAEPSPAIHERLLAEGIKVVLLGERPGSREDARATSDLANQHGVRWVVVDGYHFQSDYQRCMKDARLKVLFVDDAGKSGPYSADIVLNQNLHAGALMYSQRGRDTRLLLGASYILLRRDFTAFREVHHPVRAVARKLLVSIGGSDPDNITAKVFEMLPGLEVTGWEAIAVVAENSPCFAGLAETIRIAALPIEIVQNAGDMAKLMRWADLAITAGGTTIWELAFMGVPAVAMTRGEHERLLLQAAAAQGVAIDVGPFQSVTPRELGRVVASLALDEARRLNMSAAGRTLVDGLGATRVVQAMGEECATER